MNADERRLPITNGDSQKGEPPMHADARRLRLDEITKTIIGASHDVANTLGGGFLEKVYENALALDLRRRGLRVEQQRPIDVYYHGDVVGSYLADLLVEGVVVVELKVVKALDSIHEAQCMNYLKATGLSVCLLINFYTSRVQVKRIVNDF